MINGNENKFCTSLKMEDLLFNLDGFSCFLATGCT